VVSSEDGRRLRHLEEENRRLRHIVADLTLDREVLKGVIEKTAGARKPSSDVAFAIGQWGDP
jgi:putative transposase